MTEIPYNLADIATNPTQYDSPHLRWGNVGTAESTRTQFYIEHMRPFYEDFEGKRVLDVGSGTGWLVDAARQYGAALSIGIEPSADHVRIARERYPDARIVHSSFADFSSEEKFDVITAIMSLSHMDDLPEVFEKLRTLTSDGGKVIAAVPGYEYTKTLHAGCMECKPIDYLSYVAVSSCSGGVITDIVRKDIVYQRVAEAAGFRLAQNLPMTPTESQINRSPRFADVRDEAISSLLVFEAQQI